MCADDEHRLSAAPMFKQHNLFSIQNYVITDCGRHLAVSKCTYVRRASNRTLNVDKCKKRVRERERHISLLFITGDSQFIPIDEPEEDIYEMIRVLFIAWRGAYAKYHRAHISTRHSHAFTLHCKRSQSTKVPTCLYRENQERQRMIV